MKYYASKICWAKHGQELSFWSMSSSGSLDEVRISALNYLSIHGNAQDTVHIYEFTAPDDAKPFEIVKSPVVEKEAALVAEERAMYAELSAV